MNAIWYGIANAFEALFGILPHIGNLTNWFFGIVITIGTVYWLWYDKFTGNGGSNYMADKG